MIVVLALVVGLLPSAELRQVSDSTWRDHDRAADSAAAKRNWPDYLYHVRVLDSALHHHPGATVALARGYAQIGDTATAWAMLRALVASGVFRDLSKDSLLGPLHPSQSWAALLRNFDANKKSVGSARAIVTHADSGFAAEDIAFDARRSRHLLSGIRGRSVVAIARDGRVTTLLASREGAPLWAVMALGIDAKRDRLWLTTVGDDRIPGLTAGEHSHASILCIDLATGSVLRRFDLPEDATPREPSDLVVSREGRVFVSDGRTGAIYSISPSLDSVAVLVPVGTFFAPQQPVIGRGGRTLIVPDYALGLAEVELATRRVRWFSNARSILLNGIDGLTRSGEHTLVAVQNGVVPARVVRLTIDEANASVVRSEVLAQGPPVTDPTHGVMVGDEYHVIAYGGGGALKPDGSLREGELFLPPVIARIPLGTRSHQSKQ